MGGYWELIGHYDAETATYSAFAGSFGTSPYTPSQSGTIKALRVQAAATAATSLFEGVQVKLTCKTFDPQSIECGLVGGGLRTATAPNSPSEDWVCNQSVQAGVPITMEARNIAGTPVTVNVFVWAYFD